MKTKGKDHQFASMTLTGFVSGMIAAALIVSPFLGRMTEQVEEEIHFVAASSENQTKKIIDVAPLSETEWQEFRTARSALFQSTLTLAFPEELKAELEDGSKAECVIPLFDHPEWIILERKNSSIVATLDATFIEPFLIANIDPIIPRATNLALLAVPAAEKLRATLGGKMVDGWAMDAHAAAEYIAENVAARTLTIIIPIDRQKGIVENKTDSHAGKFALLARGKSDFAGSVPNRIHNIKKTLNEKLNGIYIPVGETFSFVDSLDGPVELGTGWLMALGIFEGTDLRPTPGGGVCQASTTIYRAALLAGLPITEQRNHSMYIKYYRKSGEGLDATIFVGSQDLTFVNDTAGPILVLARTEGTEAIVEFYGTPDGRRVTLEGPYRHHDAPEEIKTATRNQRKVGILGNEIVWTQTIARDGKEPEEKLLISRYQDEIPWKTTADAKITEMNDENL